MNHQADLTKSLSQQAYEQIRHKIVSLVLQPGDVINEADLRAQLGFGRTPIREALQRLALEKLVMIVPRRGMFVTQIELTDLQRLFEMRLQLEAMAARLATHRGHELHWQQMERILQDLEGAGACGNECLIQVDEHCHQIVYDAADNKFLADTLTMLFALSLRMWYFALSQVDDMQHAVDEHRAILDALRARDETLAAELTEQHIRQFQEKIQAVLIGTPSL